MIVFDDVWLQMFINDKIWIFIMITHAHIHTLIELSWKDCGELLATNFESFCN